MTLDEFFETYRRAVLAGDGRRLALFYDVPLTVVRPARTAVIATHGGLCRELQKICDTYLWMGMAGLERRRFEEVGFEESLGIVNITWRPVDAAGRAIVEIDTSYTIRGGPGGLRIASVTAHNEEERRRPLIQAARRGSEG